MSQMDDSAYARSSLVSRNITIDGRRTSVRLEPEMWQSLKEIAERERCTIHDLCGLIALKKGKNSSLTAAIRVFLMLYFRASSTQDGHDRAGHGDFSQMCRRAGIKSGEGAWRDPAERGDRGAATAQIRVRYS